MIKVQQILFLYPSPPQNITGGHKYEAELQTALSNNFEVKNESLFDSDKIGILQKVYAPIKAVCRLPKLRKSTIVVFNSAMGMYFLLLTTVMRICGYKTAVVHHHFISEELTDLKKCIYGFVEKAFLKSVTYVITPSPHVKDLIHKYIDREAYLIPIPFPAPKRVEALPRKGQLLYIGTIEQRKGLDHLLNSLTLLDKPELYKLHIVGKIVNNDYYQRLLQKISVNNLSVTFHGYLSEEDMSKVISESDVFVFPSLLEGFGMAINEMRFYGLPVICFDNSALPYSVTDGLDGILVPDKDSEKLAEAIKTVVNDRSLRAKLSAASLERSKHLTTSEEFSSIANQVFESLTNR